MFISSSLALSFLSPLKNFYSLKVYVICELKFMITFQTYIGVPVFKSLWNQPSLFLRIKYGQEKFENGDSIKQLNHPLIQNPPPQSVIKMALELFTHHSSSFHSCFNCSIFVGLLNNFIYDQNQDLLYFLTLRTSWKRAAKEENNTQD